MKVTVGHIVEQYNSALKADEEAINGEIKSYNTSKDYVLEKISHFKNYIETFTNINYNQISTLNRAIPEKSIRLLTGQIGFDPNTLRRSLNVIVEINKQLEKLEEELNEVKASILTNEISKEILYKFNEKLSNEIVMKGYTFALGFQMGNIRIKKVRCDRRVKKRIDWGATNKKKAEIIASGGLPYKVEERNEAGEITKDNGGIPYFVYHTNDFDYLWHWNKKRVTVLNSAYYKFRPTYYNNTVTGGTLGNVNKLKQLVTTDSPLLKNFFE